MPANSGMRAKGTKSLSHTLTYTHSSFSIHKMLRMFLVCETLATRNKQENTVAEHVLQYLRDKWNESIEAKLLVHMYY